MILHIHPSNFVCDLFGRQHRMKIQHVFFAKIESVFLHTSQHISVFIIRKIHIWANSIVHETG